MVEHPDDPTRELPLHLGRNLMLSEPSGLFNVVGIFNQESAGTGMDGYELWVMEDAAFTVPGDFDYDGDVDAFDLLIWQNGFCTGTSHDAGDADFDGDVDVFDLLVWQTNYGSAASSVPEPSTLVLVLLGGLWIAMQTTSAGRRKSGPRGRTCCC
jgi:hypothetical protein